jgi:hypothetical protein
MSSLNIRTLISCLGFLPLSTAGSCQMYNDDTSVFSPPWHISTYTARQPLSGALLILSRKYKALKNIIV